MMCPRCGTENLPGNDRCENCLEPFRDRDVPQAGAGFQRVLMEQPVGAIATTSLVVVPSDATVAEAVSLMRSKRIGCVLVISEGALVGIFTERDLVNVMAADSKLDTITISDVMTREPETVEANDSLRFALHKMSVGGFRHIPVVSGGRATGLVSTKDVIRLLAGELARA